MASPASDSSNDVREPWLAVLDTAADASKVVRDASKGVRLYVGPKAYRVYNSFTGSIGRNLSGNLRGMVLNRQFRTVFDVSLKVGDAAKQAAFFLSFVREAWISSRDIDRSNHSFEAKLQFYSLVPASALSRVLIGTASGLNSLLMTAGETACRGAPHGSAYLLDDRIVSADACTEYFNSMRIETAFYYRRLHEATSVSAIRDGIEDLEWGVYRYVQAHVVPN